jgi:hypothetical protein
MTPWVDELGRQGGFWPHHDQTAERAIAIGDWPDGQADASAAHDEHAAVARGPIEHQAVVSLPVQFLASVTERTAGVSVGSVRSMSSRTRC